MSLEKNSSGYHLQNSPKTLGFSQGKKISRVSLLDGAIQVPMHVMNLSSSEEIRSSLSLSAPTGEPLMEGLEFVWSDRSLSFIKDISFSGITIHGRGHIGKAKVGEPITARLRLEDGSYLPLQLLIQKISANQIAFEFENPVGGRITLEQSLKDQIIARNMRELIPTKLFGAHKPDLWLHGPFDTNVLIWQSEDRQSSKKFIIEYDHLVLIDNAEATPFANASVKASSDFATTTEAAATIGATVNTNTGISTLSMAKSPPSTLSMAKSQSSCEPTQNYFSPLFEQKVSRVSLGSTYYPRLFRVLTSEKLQKNLQPEQKQLLESVIQKLRANPA